MIQFTPLLMLKANILFLIHSNSHFHKTYPYHEHFCPFYFSKSLIKTYPARFRTFVKFKMRTTQILTPSCIYLQICNNFTLIGLFKVRMRCSLLEYIEKKENRNKNKQRIKEKAIEHYHKQ